MLLGGKHSPVAALDCQEGKAGRHSRACCHTPLSSPFSVFRWAGLVSYFFPLSNFESNKANLGGLLFLPTTPQSATALSSSLFFVKVNQFIFLSSCCSAKAGTTQGSIRRKPVCITMTVTTKHLLLEAATDWPADDWEKGSGKTKGAFLSCKYKKEKKKSGKGGGVEKSSRT